MGRRIGALHRTIDRAVNKPKGTKELIDKLQRLISAAQAGKLRDDSSSQAAGAVPARSTSLVTEQGNKAGAIGKSKSKSAKLGKDSSPGNFRPAILVPKHWHGTFVAPKDAAAILLTVQANQHYICGVLDAIPEGLEALQIPAGAMISVILSCNIDRASSICAPALDARYSPKVCELPKPENVYPAEII